MWGETLDHHPASVEVKHCVGMTGSADVLPNARQHVKGLFESAKSFPLCPTLVYLRSIGRDAFSHV